MSIFKYSLFGVVCSLAASCVTYHQLTRDGAKPVLRQLDAPVQLGVAVSAPSEVRRLEHENADLAEQLKEAVALVAEREALLARTQEHLDELRRPMTADIFSSALRAELKSGEVVVTGGYRLPDGRRLYAFAKPVVGTGEAGDTVSISSRFVSLGDEAGKSVGLDNLRTNAANTVQHGEVWVADEESQVFHQLAGMAGIDVVTSPVVSVKTGNSGLIEIGDLRLKVTPSVVAGSDTLQFEVRLEQPQAPTALEDAAADRDQPPR